MVCCDVCLWLAEKESTNMNFVELAGNQEGENDLEILKESPVKMIDPKAPPNKGKGISTVISKRKAGGIAPVTEKLMPDALRARALKRQVRAKTNVSKEVGKKTESLMSVGTNRTFGLN